MQCIAFTALPAQPCAEMTYGQRFRQVRKARWGKTVLDLARKLGSNYAQAVYAIENDWRVPNLPTIEKHAAALSCEPWELLEDVETEYDAARELRKLPRVDASIRWQALIARYRKSARTKEAGGTTAPAEFSETAIRGQRKARAADRRRSISENRRVKARR